MFSHFKWHDRDNTQHPLLFPDIHYDIMNSITDASLIYSYNLLTPSLIFCFEKENPLKRAINTFLPTLIHKYNFFFNKMAVFRMIRSVWHIAHQKAGYKTSEKKDNWLSAHLLQWQTGNSHDCEFPTKKSNFRLIHS